MLVDPGQVDGTIVNPVTLLATDYLSHFTAAIMLLEMIVSTPECKEGFLSCRPMNYCAQFAQSQFKHRDLAIAAYEIADPRYRNEIEQLAGHMSMIPVATHHAIRSELSPQMLGVMAETTARWLWLLVGRAGAVINGEVEDTAATSDRAPLDTVDALLDREIEEAFRA